MIAPLKVGDAVSVVQWVNTRQVIRPASVRHIGSDDGRILMQVSPGSMPYFCHQEGITWCRGHTGPAVEALHVALALT